MRLTLRQLSVYLRHIPTITAKEALIESVVAGLPYMDEEAQARVLNEWVGISSGADTEDETFAQKWSGDRVSFEEFTQGEMRERAG